MGGRTCPRFLLESARHPAPPHETMATPPNCLCTMVPRTADGGAILGNRAVIDFFAKLPEEQQQLILGPAKFDAYQAGKIQLSDLARFRRDRVWRSVGYERSL